jgi:hypothetical protein
MTPSSSITATGVIEDWPAGFSRDLPDDHWLVVHSLPRQDKKLIADLRARQLPGLAFFERRLRHYPGKGVQESLVPLLGGYVFVAGRERDKESIFATRRVVKIIDIRRPEQLTADLRCLCVLVAAAQGPFFVRPELVPGRRVVVTKGTFAGCCGVIHQRRGLLEMVVNLELLGTSVSVAMPATLAEPTAILERNGTESSAPRPFPATARRSRLGR